MTKVNTTSSNANSDSTKVSDVASEFCAGFGAGIVGAGVAVGGTVIAITAATAAATAAAAAVSAVDVAVFYIAVASIVLSFSGIAAAFGACSIFTAGFRPLGQSRPLARKLGLAVSGCSMLAAAAVFAAHPPGTKSPTAARVSTNPKMVFNVTAEDCQSEQVKATISKIKADGFSVTCAKPAP